MEKSANISKKEFVKAECQALCVDEGKTARAEKPYTERGSKKFVKLKSSSTA